MSSIVVSGDTSGSVTLQAPLVAGSTTIILPTAVTASTTNTNTNKIAITINGTVYYLLASTSAT
jgi:biopolymer transport protein ExbD